MSDNWGSIKTIDGWQAKLQEILAAAEAASNADNFDQIQDARSRLVEFITHSVPDSASEIQEMDEIAKKARKDLVERSIDKRLKSLSDRTSELAKLTKTVTAQAEASAAKAGSIRLERAQNAVTSLTDTVSQLKDFSDTLETGTDEELSKSVSDIIGSIQSLRNKIEGAK